MRRTFGFLGLVGLAAIAAARLVPAGVGDFVKALQDASTLQANYTLQPVGGSPERYAVELKKPNFFRVETPKSIFVSDGKELTTFDKTEKYYYKQPVSADVVNGIFKPEALNIWAGFFDAKALQPVASKSLGLKSRAGQSLEAIEATYDTNRKRVVTYFINPADKVARQAQIDLNQAGGKATLILNAKDVRVGGAVGSDVFAFKAPDDSRETTLAELSAAKWFTNLDDAKKAAAATGKRIFVDFMASWCGPCKMLDREVLQTERFKDIASKKLVLLRIDVDEQPSISALYKVEAMPTQMVLDAKGSVIAETVGYGGPDAFYGFLLPNLG